ncbi:hypothetical protein A3A79_02665 [Candidatus Gottesmanbacteria bacterium RIFCSPLOWO2_01_FULL_43_11b]|uniref:DUF6922 domain-containing protein n=1 Tax=Candidatus Gottesmanbacteria bacterium RIFCSPLOWO2_01_FULL_43_11b TaxID=1798392 RepID=A0A1F6AHB3_9BACT|nr:MAG: hypothetical protein A3A79_02665 [Candidatus Gottesmanbacteria bacterium RIFCSPLOWO2_01_FULL_43_11b]
MQAVPQFLKSILWSTDVNRLDLARDKQYIIHQVLRLGDFSALRWLFRTYGKQDIIHTFIHKPAKEYPRRDYYFVKNMLLSLNDRSLDEEAYVTTFFGPIRQRAQNSLV